MKFYESYAEGQPNFYASQEEADYLINDLRNNVGGDYENVDFEEIFREVDFEEIEIEDVVWGDTSAETKRAMVEQIETIMALREVMTVEEVAETYRLESGTVRRTIHLANIPARHSGKNWLIKRADAEARWGQGKLKPGRKASK